MPNVIAEFLTLYKKNNYEDKEIIKNFLDENDLLTRFKSADYLFNTIHREILKMFSVSKIFDQDLDLSPERFNQDYWQENFAQEVFNKIKNKSYNKDSNETNTRRGLIQVYLYYFGNCYIGYEDFQFQDLPKYDIVHKYNPNTLQKNREFVLQRLQNKILSLNKEEVLIDREIEVTKIIMQMNKINHLMIIGPLGIGKSKLLRIIKKRLYPEWNIFLYSFIDNLIIQTDDQIERIILNVFENRAFEDRTKPLLLLFDDIHFLPQKKLIYLFTTIIPKINASYNENVADLKIISASILELNLQFQNTKNNLFSTYFLQPFTRNELAELLDLKNINIPVDNLYDETFGYPIFVSQVLERGEITQNSDWYKLIQESMEWDPDIQTFLNAICTFRYTDPLFLQKFSSFVNNEIELRDKWGIPNRIFELSVSIEYWKKILHMQSFISRITFDEKKLSNMIHRISIILRKLVERHMKNTNISLFLDRHETASNYYKVLFLSEKLPLEKKQFPLIEYIFHLKKLELNSEAIIKNVVNVFQSMKDFSSDTIISFIEVFENKLRSDEELKDELSETIIEQIIYKIRTVSGDFNG